jgi:ABC-type transport system involved in cytochrome c biogenesis permease subunit
MSLHTGNGSPQSFKLIEAWRTLINSYLAKNNLELKKNVALVAELSETLSQTHVNLNSIHWEYTYNQLKLLNRALVCYLATFILLIASLLFWKRVLKKICLGVFGLGGVAHLTAIVLRIAILGRPPVTTLFESIVFVGLITVIFSLILEWRIQNSLGLMIGSIAGSILLLIGQSYSNEEDTMRMLAAVLNTNFWLATHVVTITIGYGCCFVGGLVGHVYLIRKIFYPANQAALAQIFRNMVGISLVALFFSLFGTILGGIWADQSWGRFWGWDPKENGALLIVLWLLWLLHSRLTNLTSPSGYAVGMVITNIIVALAWFGVNLLNVGLHSYGFAEGIALNLALFIGGEILFICVTSVWSRRISVRPS